MAMHGREIWVPVKCSHALWKGSWKSNFSPRCGWTLFSPSPTVEEKKKRELRSICCGWAVARAVACCYIAQQRHSLGLAVVPGKDFTASAHERTFNLVYERERGEKRHTILRVRARVYQAAKMTFLCVSMCVIGGFGTFSAQHGAFFYIFKASFCVSPTTWNPDLKTAFNFFTFLSDLVSSAKEDIVRLLPFP